MIVEVIKKKKFPVGKAPGLRIRSEPSLAATSVGVIKPGDEFVYTDEVSFEPQVIYSLQVVKHVSNVINKFFVK